MLLDHLDTLSGTDLAAVLVPCVIPRPALEALVGALYRGALPLDADNVEPLYRAADAMQVGGLRKEGGGGRGSGRCIDAVIPKQSCANAICCSFSGVV
jgi:hypothetical protein